MAELSMIRAGYDSYQDDFETRLLRSVSIQESMNQWLILQRTFEWQLQQTEELFEPERREALAELQQRLLSILRQ